jgi:hypothetical protein
MEWSDCRPDSGWPLLGELSRLHRNFLPLDEHTHTGSGHLRLHGFAHYSGNGEAPPVTTGWGRIVGDKERPWLDEGQDRALPLKGRRRHEQEIPVADFEARPAPKLRLGGVAEFLGGGREQQNHVLADDLSSQMRRPRPDTPCGDIILQSLALRGSPGWGRWRRLQFCRRKND